MRVSMIELFYRAESGAGIHDQACLQSTLSGGYSWSGSSLKQSHMQVCIIRLVKRVVADAVIRFGLVADPFQPRIFAWPRLPSNVSYYWRSGCVFSFNRTSLTGTFFCTCIWHKVQIIVPYQYQLNESSSLYDAWYTTTLLCHFEQHCAFSIWLGIRSKILNGVNPFDSMKFVFYFKNFNMVCRYYGLIFIQGSIFWYCWKRVHDWVAASKIF